MNIKERQSKRSLWIFPLFLALYEMAAYISNDAYLPALPQVTADLHTTHHMIQLSLTTWFTGMASIQLIMGPLSDRFGRRRVLLTGSCVFIASCLACALTQSVNLLLIFRFIQGATIASLITPGYATIHELFEQKQAIAMLANMNIITIFAPAFGPILGAAIIFFSDWRAIFVLLSIWGLVTMAGLIYSMPETKQAKYKFNFLAIIKSYKFLLINKRYITFQLSNACVFGAIIAWITAGPFLIVTKFHQSAWIFSLLQGLIFSALILGNTIVKWLMKRFRLYNIIYTCISLPLIGSIWITITSWISPSKLSYTIIGMVVISFGEGIIAPILGRLAVESSTEPMGSRVAMGSFLICLFGMIASMLTSAIFNNTLFSLGVIVLSFTILSFLLPLAQKIKEI